MNRIKKFFIVPLLVLSLSGCVYLVVGGVGALGGYIVSPDTVEGLTDADIHQVWDTSVEIVSIMGLIDVKNESGGFIQASVNGVKVTVMMKMSSSSIKLSVKARKNYLPKISIAQDIFVKIMSRVNE